MFKEYLHLEKYGNAAVEGIELGTCYIFPKLDGTNASVWMEDGNLCAGSRKRQLSEEKDNAGFFKAIQDNPDIQDFLNDHPHLRLYGEWLVPHSLKTYRDDAWRKLYVFDIHDDEQGQYIPYPEYESTLEMYNIEFIRPIAVIQNVQYDSLLKNLEQNTYLIKDGEGSGEGITIKNYDFINKFGHYAYAKIVTNSFKEKHVKEMGACRKDEKQMIEQEIVDTIVDKALCQKTYSKICVENEGWSSKKIPELLGRVWYDVLTEDLVDVIKKLKNPTVNFKTLNILTIMKIKQLLPEVF